MANTSTGEKWYFTKEQLENTPSRKCGFDAHKELSYRQQAANFIQDMGQKLKVSQLCINTAIVYMHRFYVFHSFTHFPWHQMAAAALFLAAKVEEQPRKLEYVIKISNLCRNGTREPNIDINSDRYIQQSQDLVFNENVLLQTLGFDVAIDHPHTHVVRCCHLVRASKDLARTSYFMASNSLHLTTMCLQYKPTVVACFCILVACKWSNWEIPLSNEKKEWYSYVDPTVTADLLQQLIEEFLVIFEASPSRLKIAFNADIMMSHGSYNHINSPFDTDPKKIVSKDDKSHNVRTMHENKSSENDAHKHRPSSQRLHESGAPSSTLTSSSSSSQLQQQQHRDRNRDRERLSAQQQQQKVMMKMPSTSSTGVVAPHHHHRPVVDQRMKHQQSRPSGYAPSNRVEPRDILREGLKDSFGLAKEKRDYVKPENHPQRPKVPMTMRRPEDNKQQAYVDVKKQQQPMIGHDKIKPLSNPVKMEIKTEGNKNEAQNGNDSSYYNTPTLLPPMEMKKEVKEAEDEEPAPAPSSTAGVIKRPSLFSPEQTPKFVKTEFSKQESITTTSTLTPSLSPISSPLTIKRNRNYSSSSSEPELRPVIKKIDQVEGFENLIRDSTIVGVNKLNQNSASVDNVNKTVVNGLETNTNPIVISNLLKETVQQPQEVVAKQDKEQHHHHKSKKKNKEKHKHKDKDKSKEDKEKKKKHKDKDRHHKNGGDGNAEGASVAPPTTEPIKLKIQKDRIQPIQSEQAASSSAPTGGHSLKIKIPKDKIKTEAINELAQPATGAPTQPIRLKIPKEKLGNLDSSRKRDRDSNRTSPGDATAPPIKLQKTSHSKQNGRHSNYGKVAQTGGDGETSLHRLAESKYTHKSSTTS